MTSLPLSFRVKNAVVEKHQLEGTDPSERYFNRLVPIKRVGCTELCKKPQKILPINSAR
jgi:hypothetical protein